METTNQTRLEWMWRKICKACEWVKEQIVNFVLGVITLALIVVAILVIILGTDWLIKGTPLHRFGGPHVLLFGLAFLAMVLPIGKSVANYIKTRRGRR